MRASDQVLHDALRDAGFLDLASRAAAGEWNDYFGTHAMPQHDLIHALRARRNARNTEVVEGLVRRIMDGDFDGTREESEEWARSPEGRATFNELSESFKRRA
jgi:hypothetical protein